tara:strand:+ start:189 stop:404 length:216 start_codon:yes stop_codon:yes gene_type:complete
MTRVKLEVNRHKTNAKEEVIFHSDDGAINIGFYNNNIHEFITFNLKSIPKIVDVLLFINNMETRLNPEEGE